MARFNDTTEQGRGFNIYVPVGALNITFRFYYRAQTAPPATRTAGLKVYFRAITSNVATPAWSNKVLTNLTLSNLNTNWQLTTQTYTLASFGISADTMYKCEITRPAPTSGTNLVGDLTMWWMQVEFS